ATDEDVVDGATFYVDADGDGFGTTAVTACSAPAGTAPVGGDCDDAVAQVHPGRSEVCNVRDDDCDGAVDEDAIDRTVYHADADLDGFGDPVATTLACAPPAGFLVDATDCDDARPQVHPGAVELCDGGLDDDCDVATDDDDAPSAPTWYTDADGDGHGDPLTAVRACAAPAGTVSSGDDCDDAAVGVGPGSPEVCNGVDDDCDPATSEAGLIATGGVVYPTVGAAVAAALTGGRVDVCAGVYTERLTLTRSVSIVGHGDPTLDGNGAGSVIIVRANDVTLDGLTLANGDAFFGGGVLLDARARFVGRDLTLTGNEASFGAGIALFSPSTPPVLDRIVATGNLARSRGGGLDLYSGSATCTDCAFDGNDSLGDGGGVSIRTGSTTLTLVRASVAGNTAHDGGGLDVSAGGLAVLVDSVVEDNVASRYGGGARVANNGDLSLTGTAVTTNSALAGGGAMVEVGGGLVAASTDWGAGATDNAPNDVGSTAATLGTYGAGASFSCDGVICQ
ncbi:MAG: MopE-related protein, partial [Myxococcota bacterium]